MPTRLQIMQRMAAHLGGYYGNITSGTSTTAVLEGLVGTTGDNSAFTNWHLFMPDAANTGDTERVVSSWTDSTGTATWTGARTDTTYTSETYIMIPAQERITLARLRQAIDEMMETTRRTVMFTIPTRDSERYYTLADLSWVRSPRDVDGVVMRLSPGLLDNEDFSKWQSSSVSTPDSWTLAGSGATVERTQTNSSYGGYAVNLTRASNDATLTQNVPHALARRMIDDRRAVAISVPCVASVASRVRVGINDGVDTTYSSSYHSGDGEWEVLTATRTLTAAASRIQAVLSVDSGDTTGTFDAVHLAEGTAITADFSDAGSSGFREQYVPYDVVHNGAAPAIRVEGPLGEGRQLVVYSRRPFSTLSADSSRTDLDIDTAIHGALYFLFSKHRPGEDRARADRLATIHGKAYTQRLSALIQKPAMRPISRVVVGGA